MLSNKIKVMDHQIRVENRKVSKIVLIKDMVHVGNDKGEMNQILIPQLKTIQGWRVQFL